MPKKPDPLVQALSALRRLVTALPGAEEYIMVHHPAFRVGKKPFAIVGMDQSTTLSINLGPEAQADLLSDSRFSRTHYIGQHGWVTVDYDRLSAGEVASLVEGSWQRIAGKKHLAAHAASGSGASLGSSSPGRGAAPKRVKKAPSAAGKAKASKKPTSAAKKPAKSAKKPAKKSRAARR